MKCALCMKAIANGAITVVGGAQEEYQSWIQLVGLY